MTKHSMDIKYSIIIPTLYRAANLKKCLTCLSKVNFDANVFEVLVIDNGPTDDIKHVADSFKNKVSCLQYFVSDMPGLHTGRNLGLKKAKGEILCYIDDDSFVTEGWLKGISKAFEDPKVALVGGPCLPEFDGDPPGWLDYFWSECEFGKTLADLSLLDFGEKLMPIPPIYVYGCNFNIRKDILLKLEGFHPDAFPKNLLRFRGDGETYVSRKLVDMGYEFLYCPDVKIYHFVSASRMTKDYFCNRSYIQGISNSFVQIRKQHGLNTEFVRGLCGRERYSKGKENKILSKMKILIAFFKKAGNYVKYRLELYRKQADAEYTAYLKVKHAARMRGEEGFKFHQAEVKHWPSLLEWALRKNYLGQNGKLPE